MAYDYLHEITRRNDEHFTWGDGDSLDRERVRDILVIKYGYDKTFYGGSVLWEDFKMNFDPQMKTKKKGLCIELTQGQYDHLYNIMCSR